MIRLYCDVFILLCAIDIYIQSFRPINLCIMSFFYHLYMYLFMSLYPFLLSLSLSPPSFSLSLSLPPEPYTLRDVMGHIQRLQELIGVNVLQSSYSCTNGLSLSFLTPLISTTLDAMSTGNRDSQFYRCYFLQITCTRSAVLWLL